MRMTSCVVVGLLATVACAAEPKTKEEDRKYVTIQPLAETRVDCDHYVWKQSDDKSIDEKHVAKFFFRELRTAKVELGYMHCAEWFTVPPMSKGDIFPYKGRLHEMDGDSGEKFYTKVLFPSEYPKGAAPAGEFSFFVPLYQGHDEGCQFNRMFDDRMLLPKGQRYEHRRMVLRLTDLTPEKTDRGTRLAAALRCVFRDDWDVKLPEETATVRAGDILVLPTPVNAGLVVLNIVPKDEMSKTIGWVELSPKYIPLNDVEQAGKDQKRAVVHFAVAKKQ